MDAPEGWHVVSSESGFQRMRPDWERLFDQNPRHSPFQSWGWVAAWLKYLAGPHELLIACHRNASGDLDFILPLIRRTGGSGPGKPNVVLACSFGPECSEKLGCLRSPGLDEHSAKMTAEAISRFLRPGDFGLLAPLGDDQFPERVSRAVGQTGRRTSIRPDVVSPTLPLPGSWEDYLQQLSSNFRSQIRRSVKNFTRSGDLVIRSLDPAGAEEFTRQLIRLNRTRMQVKGEVSSMEDDAFQGFLLEAIPYLAAAKSAWMDAVEDGSGIVGVALNLVHGRNIYYYSGGFEDRFGKMRPGTALFARAIQRGIESGYQTFDFLRGEESYKYRWGAGDIVDSRVLVFPASPVAAGLAATADGLGIAIDRMKLAYASLRARRQ